MPAFRRGRHRGHLSGKEVLIAGTNISISILTLLLLPIIQATQNRDGAALQAKLDELIKTNGEARDALIGLEAKGEKEIERMRPDPHKAKAPPSLRSV